LAKKSRGGVTVRYDGPLVGPPHPKAQRYVSKVTVRYEDGKEGVFLVITQNRRASDAILLLETCEQAKATYPSYYSKNSHKEPTSVTAVMVGEIDVALPERPISNSIIRHLWQKDVTAT